MKKKSYLALIMAVTLAAQAPMMAVCAEESESTSTDEDSWEVWTDLEDTDVSWTDSDFTFNGSITVTGEGATGIGASGDVDVTVDGDVTVEGDYSNAIRTEDGSTVTVNGDVSATGEDSQAISSGSDYYDEDEEEDIYIPGGTITVNGDVTGNVLAVAETDVTVSGDVEGYIYSNDSTVSVGGDVTGNGWSAVQAANDSTVTVDGDVIGSDYGSAVYADASTVVIGGSVTGGYGDDDGEGADSAIYAENGSTVTVSGDVTGIGGVWATGDSTTVTVDGNVASTDWSAAEAYDGAEVTVNGDASCEQNTIWAEDSTITINGDVTGGGDCNVIDAYNSTVTVNGDVTSDGYSAIHVEDGSTVTVTGTVTGNTDGITGDNTNTVVVTGDVNTNDGSAISIQLTDNTGDGVIIVEGTAYAGEDCPVIWLGIGTDEDDNALDIEDALASMPTIIVGTLVASDEDGTNYIYYESNGTETDEEQEETLEEIYDAIYYIISVTQPDNGSISVDGTQSLYGYSVANEDDTLMVTITVNSGYELSSVSGGSVTLTLNDDGTYTLIVPRGGGVDISAVIKAIVSAATSTDSSSSSSSSSSSDDSSSDSSASVVETGLKALSVAQAGEAVNTQTVPVTILSADGTATAMTLDTVINAVQTMIESAAETVQSLMTTAPTEFFTQTVEALYNMKGGDVIVNDCGTVKTVASAVDVYGNTIASAGVIENVTSGSLVLLMGVNADGTIEYVEGVIDPVTGAVLGIFENVPVTITVLVLA